MDLEIMVLNNELVILKRTDLSKSGAKYEIIHRIPRKKIMFPKDWDPERYFFHVDS